MRDETRKQIALFRYRLIAPVLAEPGRVQNEYFRKQADKEHNLPHYGPRKIALSTMKRWLRLYRQQGFEALAPKPRADAGRPRRLQGEVLDAVRAKCRAFPYWTVRKLYEDLHRSGQLGDPPACYNTLLRTIRAEKLLHHGGRTDYRKRYEADAVNELWVGDFMHGPKVKTTPRARRAILCAIIDDHSRMIVGHGFSVHENIGALTVVLKEAFEAFGLPRRLYVDNGAAFSSDLLTAACAQTGIALIHSRPYDSPSRGKIERFFRTVRERFLPGVPDLPTLPELNEAFALWLKEDYHHKLHTGVDQRPIDRYQASADRTEIRRLSRAELDAAFLVRHERIVNHDATISFRNGIYEVPAAYTRQRIEIRHPVDAPGELYLFDNGVQVAQLKQVDVKENAKNFEPSRAEDPVSFAKGKVEK